MHLYPRREVILGWSFGTFDDPNWSFLDFLDTPNYSIPEGIKMSDAVYAGKIRIFQIYFK